MKEVVISLRLCQQWYLELRSYRVVQIREQIGVEVRLSIAWSWFEENSCAKLKCQLNFCIRAELLSIYLQP